MQHTCMNETLYSWTFKFHKVVRQQNSGAMEDFILPYSAVYLRIHKWKNYWNRSTFAKVIVKIIVAPFYGPRCICAVLTSLWRHYDVFLSALNDTPLPVDDSKRACVLIADIFNTVIRWKILHQACICQELRVWLLVVRWSPQFVAEFGDSRRFWRQSPNSATIVASVDKALRSR